MTLYGGFSIHAKVMGMRALQQANIQLLNAVDPNGGLGRAVKAAGLDLLGYAIRITHVLTGSLQASHQMDFGAGHLETSFLGAVIRSEAVARIHINPSSRNPITRERPVEYGPLEHEKGGTHAFYERTFSERGAIALAIAHSVMMSELPKGGLSLGVLRVGRRVLAGFPGN